MTDAERTEKPAICDIRLMSGTRQALEEADTETLVSFVDDQDKYLAARIRSACLVVGTKTAHRYDLASSEEEIKVREALASNEAALTPGLAALLGFLREVHP